ncbi:aspartate/glutamate racemase family protein [Microbacterium sp. 18062]|uniref:aspartate/glutamate racemase family protein n=1 Tax=Microbacterium sp. 18062 TaxID=2681410 RepID=UPI001357B883|nr:aspartate/glutamate racemase family protein [Microbacterium sp. 18062]
MTRILIIAPVGSAMHLPIEERVARAAVSADTEVVVRHLDGVPNTIYVPPEDVFLPPLVEAVRQGERDGFDAIGISCCSDPGIEQCRAAVSVPVCAPFDAVTARGHELGPIGVLYMVVDPGPGESDLRGEDWIPDLLERYGRADAVPIALPVPADRPTVAADDPDATPEQIGTALVESMARAISTTGVTQARRAQELGARALFPTCTYWSDTLAGVRQAVDIPVLDPIAELARCLERHARA